MREELESSIERVEEKIDKLLEIEEGAICVKDKQINEMHEQLLKYQSDIVDTIIEPIVCEIIDILSGINNYKRFIPEECTQEEFEKLRKRFIDVEEDLIKII